jgi:hypothetical protein
MQRGWVTQLVFTCILIRLCLDLCLCPNPRGANVSYPTAKYLVGASNLRTWQSLTHWTAGREAQLHGIQSMLTEELGQPMVLTVWRPDVVLHHGMMSVCVNLRWEYLTNTLFSPPLRCRAANPGLRTPPIGPSISDKRFWLVDHATNATQAPHIVPRQLVEQTKRMPTNASVDGDGVNM